MYSLSLFGYVSYLDKYHNGDRWERGWILFKYYSYKFLSFTSAIRVLIPAYLITYNLSPETYKKYDPYVYMLSYDLYQANVKIEMSLHCLMIYEYILGQLLLFEISRFAQPFFRDLRSIRISLDSENVKYHLLIKNQQFKESISDLKLSIAPYLPKDKQRKLITNIYRYNAMVHAFLRFYVLQTAALCFVFYNEFVKPMNMSVFWTIFYVCDFCITMNYAWNMIRCSVFVSSYVLLMVNVLSWQMKSMTQQLKQTLYRRLIKTPILKLTIYKTHMVFVHILIQNIKFNDRLVKKLYMKAVAINILSNVIIISELVAGNIIPMLQVPMRVVVVLQIAIISLVAQCFIIASDSLVGPANALFSSAMGLQRCKDREARIHVRISTLYEMIHNKTKFRYDFGPIGRVSKRSLVSFWGFYFGLILMAIDSLKT